MKEHGTQCQHCGWEIYADETFCTKCAEEEDWLPQEGSPVGPVDIK